MKPFPLICLISFQMKPVIKSKCKSWRMLNDNNLFDSWGFGTISLTFLLLCMKQAIILLWVDIFHLNS
jgi:hypothetical protein